MFFQTAHSWLQNWTKNLVITLPMEVRFGVPFSFNSIASFQPQGAESKVDLIQGSHCFLEIFVEGQGFDRGGKVVMGGDLPSPPLGKTLYLGTIYACKGIAKNIFLYKFTPLIAEILAYKPCRCYKKADLPGPISLPQLKIQHF